MNPIIEAEMLQSAMNAVAHAADMASAAVQAAAACHERPSSVFRPRLSIDGNQWCALYGENLQDGVAGFGKSPADAMWNFDKNWSATLTDRVTAKG